MFCPKCGAEYCQGYAECAECHLPLVAERPQGPEFIELITVIETANPDLISVAKSILENAHIRYLAKGEGPQAISSGSLVQIQVAQKDEQEARKLLRDLK